VDLTCRHCAVKSAEYLDFFVTSCYYTFLTPSDNAVKPFSFVLFKPTSILSGAYLCFLIYMIVNHYIILFLCDIMIIFNCFEISLLFKL